MIDIYTVHIQPGPGMPVARARHTNYQTAIRHASALERAKSEGWVVWLTPHSSGR